MTQISLTSLRNLYSANALAGSLVTEREAGGDKSVTLDQYEKKLLHKQIAATDITRRGVEPPTGRDRHKFYLLTNPDSMAYKEVILPLVYPKKKGQELRLYFSRQAPFYPANGQYWFVASPNELDAPLLGILSAEQWRAITSPTQNIALEQYLFATTSDETDNDYQESINDPELLNIVGYTPPEQKPLTHTERSAAMHFARDPRLARWQMKKTGFTCEIDPTHTTFINGATGEQYMEAHHLVPLSRSIDMGGQWSLDIAPNLLCLCPTCHRAFHHGSAETKRQFITKAWMMRQRELAAAGFEISQECLFEFYRAK